MARNTATPSKKATAPTSLRGGGGGASKYELVAASQTAQVLGSTGATGDTLARLSIQPGNTSPGAVSVIDGSTTIWTYVGGSVPTVVPFEVFFDIPSITGPWKITTGANVAVLAFGIFT